jgi:hypothetical protein
LLVERIRIHDNAKKVVIISIYAYRDIGGCVPVLSEAVTRVSFIPYSPSTVEIKIAAFLNLCRDKNKLNFGTCGVSM